MATSGSISLDEVAKHTAVLTVGAPGCERAICPKSPTTLRSFRFLCGTPPRSRIAPCDLRAEMAPLVPAACPHRRSCRDKISLGNQKFDRLDGIGKYRSIQPEKFLDIVEALSLEIRRSFAMPNHVRRDEVIERFRLTAVPCVEETPDYSLILLYRRAHLPCRRVPRLKARQRGNVCDPSISP